MQTFSDPGAQRQSADMPAVSTPLYDLGRYQQARPTQRFPVCCIAQQNPLHISWSSQRLATSSVRFC